MRTDVTAFREETSMLMSVIEEAQSAPAYPDLAEQRILITGITSECGIDIARAFADHRTRLVLQFAEASENMEAVAEIAAPTALETMAFGPVGADSDSLVRFARRAVQAFGGLDVVVNLVPLAPNDFAGAASMRAIDALVADRLRAACIYSSIAANRMSVTLTEGLILNVAVLAGRVRGRSQALASLIKAAVAAMTRLQAEEWASKAVRINAIVPQTLPLGPEPVLRSEPDMAALALYLASSRGIGLSGLLFEAQGAQASA
jgi:NAD(P)-dependent dehydrogenase (short-subunit alcohol dehydrogenase family)